MLGIQMIDRIEFVHSKIIIHRNIKPGNDFQIVPDERVDEIIKQVEESKKKDEKR